MVCSGDIQDCKIKFICIADLKEFLNAAGVTPLNNCINLTYDATGFYYEIPNYCINDPYKYDCPNKKKFIQKPKETNINIIIRKVIQEKSYTVSNISLVGDLKNYISKNFENSEIKIELIRLFYGGKELNNNDELWLYNIFEGSIVQMMVKSLEQ
jgi:hypothetical protein